MMKYILRVLLVLTILIFSVNASSIMADASSVSGNYEYELINNGKEVRITNYRGDEEYPYIPNTIEGKKVTELGSNSFKNNKYVKEVFFNSNSNLVTIHKGAFYNCDSLENVVIPDSVKNIYSSNYYNYQRTFGACKNLKTVLIGNGLGYLDEAIFEGCTSLESVTIGNSVETIYDDAFNGCTKLSTVKFGSGLKTIGSYAFYNCDSLVNITLPSNTQSIG